MKKTFITLVLGAFLTIPCMPRAEEVEIQLMEVININPLNLSIGSIETAIQEGTYSFQRIEDGFVVDIIN